MTDHLKKIFFSPEILNVFNDHNWIINIESNSKFYSYFVDEIADYYLNIHNDKDKIYLQFTLDIEIPNYLLQELLMLINIANQTSKDGFFVFDIKLGKIKYNLIPSCSSKIEEKNLNDFLKSKLCYIQSLFHNFVLGVHSLIYRDKTEVASLELLFLNNKGCA